MFTIMHCTIDKNTLSEAAIVTEFTDTRQLCGAPAEEGRLVPYIFLQHAASDPYGHRIYDGNVHVKNAEGKTVAKFYLSDATRLGEAPGEARG